MTEISRCIICGAELRPAPVGRPPKYCSNACRMRAKRRARSAAVSAVLASAPAEPDEADLSPDRLVSASAGDPTEAVVQAIVLARNAAAAFGVTAQRVCPQLAWRCERMSEHIAAGLHRYFKPER